MRPSMVCVVVLINFFGCKNPVEAPELDNPLDIYAANYQANSPVMDQPYWWGDYLMLTWRKGESFPQEFTVQRKMHLDSSFSNHMIVSGNYVSAFDYGPFVKGQGYYYRVLSLSLNGKLTASNTVYVVIP